MGGRSSRKRARTRALIANRAVNGGVLRCGAPACGKRVYRRGSKEYHDATAAHGVGFVERELLAEVDHIVAKGMGGGSAFENLQVLCRPCHKRKTREDHRAILRGRAGVRS